VQKAVRAKSAEFSVQARGAPRRRKAASRVAVQRSRAPQGTHRHRGVRHGVVGRRNGDVSAGTERKRHARRSQRQQERNQHRTQRQVRGSHGAR
jgi:hypothetical protein